MLDRPKFILMGDSLTQLSGDGWGGHLSHVYQRRADILNRGYSGYNTTFYLHLFDSYCRGLPPDQTVQLVTLFFGANDAALPDLDPHHFVSLQDYAANLKTMVQHVRKLYPKARVLFITPPPVDHPQRLAFQIQKYGDKATGILERTLENTGTYAAKCLEVASELSLPCLDLYSSMMKEDNWARFFYDGLHFSPEGNEFVGKAVVESIQTHFPELTVTKDPRTGQFCNSASSCPALTSQGPYHDQIDYRDPGKGFLLHNTN